MTHKAKVLALLRDGRPHTHLELYRLGCVAHSRVADLRRDGHRIECWTEKQRGERVHLYRLLSATEGHALPSPSSVALSSPSNPGDDGEQEQGPRDGGQLSLSIPRSGYEQERAA